MAASQKSIGLGLLLGWLVPGLGHLYMKRRPYAAIYGLVIWGLFLGGVLLSQGTAVNSDMHLTYFSCQMLAGPVTVIFEFLRGTDTTPLGEGLAILDHQTGVVYAALAGVLNLAVLCELYRRHARPEAPGPADTIRRDAIAPEGAEQ